MSEINFGGQLTEAEYRQIQALALRKFWGFAAVMLAVVVAWNILDFGGISNSGFWISIVPPFLFVAGFWMLAPRIFARRQFRSNKMIQQPMSGTISEEAFTWNISNLSSSRIPWDLLLRYRKSESLILVYQSTSQVYYFPRRYFSSDQDWIDFQGILAKKLP